MKTVSISMVEDFRALTDDILSSARGRQQAIAELAAHTHQVLGDCEAKRLAVAEELRRRLRDGEETRLETFRRTHDQTAGRVAELVAGTRRFLRDCHAKQRATAKTLRQQLTNGDSARLEAFCQMHKRVAGRVAELARDVRCKLGESHNDSVAARAVWNELASARSGARRTTRRK